MAQHELIMGKIPVKGTLVDSSFYLEGDKGDEMEWNEYIEGKEGVEMHIFGADKLMRINYTEGNREYEMVVDLVSNKIISKSSSPIGFVRVVNCV